MSFLEKLKEFADEHLVDKLKLDLSSILDGQVKVDGSYYVDKVVGELCTKMESMKLDQVSVPPMSTTFNKQLFCIPLPGEANFAEGLLTGLAKIRRFDPTEILVDVTGDKIISAKTSIGIEELAYSSATILKFLFLDSDTLTKAVLKDVKLSIGLAIKRDFSFALDMFDIDCTGKLTDFAGLSPGIVQCVQNNLETAICSSVKTLMQQDVQTILAEIVSKLEFLR